MWHAWQMYLQQHTKYTAVLMCHKGIVALSQTVERFLKKSPTDVSERRQNGTMEISQFSLNENM